MNNYIDLDECSSDILKLTLLGETLSKLDKSIAQLVENKYISIDELHIDPLTNELKFSLKSHINIDSNTLNQFTNTLTEVLNDSLSQYI
jgi:hypothetical protein